jgi:hypothetical protein
MELTQAYLKSILNYCPETGVFTRLVRTANCICVGDIAGSINGEGYLHIMIAGKRYKAHRLAWLYMTGDWPKDQIDHIDGEKANNRFPNLREATHGQNQSNTPVQQNNTSGYKGVSRVKGKRPWMARIMVAGKSIYLGIFETKELAHAAYREAADKHKGEYARY